MSEKHEFFISATTAEDLLKHLAAIDISVPSKTAGCKNWHRERYSICQFLSAFVNTDYLSYPLCLKKMSHGKSPDFRLCCKRQDIGIEVTEAASANHLDYVEYSETTEAEFFTEPSSFSSNMERLTPIEIQNLLTNELDDGHVGSVVKKEGVKFIKNAIEKKLSKLAKPEFQKFEQNWLIIYQNTPYDFFLKKEDLISGIKNFWPFCASPCFDKIFIESADRTTNQSFIIELSSRRVKYFPIKELWKGGV